MESVKKVINTFFYVLSGSIISTAIFITIFLRDLYFNVEVIWQVIVMAAITSLGTLIYHSNREISKNRMRLLLIIHYTFINVVVLGCAVMWQWINVHRITQIFTMVLLIAGVYFSVTTVMFRNEKRIAENINQRLRTRYPEEEKKEE